MQGQDLTAAFAGLDNKINQVFSVMTGKVPVLSGPKGDTGAGAEINWQGEWAPGTYNINDGVSYGGQAYVSASSANTGTPGVDPGWASLGTPGATGQTGSTGATGRIGDTGVTGAIGTTGATGATGETGEMGATGVTGASGIGIPAGGNTGQVLGKASGSSYDVEWIDGSAGPAGATGQFTFNSGDGLTGSAALVYSPSGPTGTTGPGPTIYIGANLVPDAHETYDLGSTGLAFRDLHLSGSSIYIGGEKLSVVDGALKFNGAPIEGGGATSVPTDSFTLLGGSSGLFYSYDGNTWTDTEQFTEVNGIAWNGTIWVVVGEDNSGIVLKIANIMDNWINVDITNLIPEIEAINTVLWDGIKWIAICDTLENPPGLSIYSYDGIHWLKCKPTQGFNRVVFNGSMYIATGQGASNPPEIGISYDGLDYTLQPVTPYTEDTVSYLTIAWNGSVWVMGGFNFNQNEYSNGIIVYSYDGINWLSADVSAYWDNSATPVTITNLVYAISWIDTFFVAVGKSDSGPVYLISTDGISWDQPLFPLPPEATLKSISVNASNLMIGTDTGIIIPNTLSQITVGNASLIVPRRVLAVAKPKATSESFMVGGGDKVSYTYDGLTWTPSSTGNAIFTTCTAVAYNGSMWVAGGTNAEGGVIAYSKDGINWIKTTISNLTQTSLSGNITGTIIGTELTVDSTVNGSIFPGMYLQGYPTVVIVSGKGPTYTLSETIAGYGTTGPMTFKTDNLIFTQCRAIATNGTRWVAGGTTGLLEYPETYTQGLVAYSDDGVLWYESANQPFGTSCDTVAWVGGTTFFAGGLGSNQVISGNGDTWEPVNDANAIFTDRCTSLAYNGDIVVAIGYITEAETSTVGYYKNGTWSESTTGTALGLTISAWNRSIWIAIGVPTTAAPETRPVAYSYNGITWNTRTSVAFNLGSLAWNGTLWISGISASLGGGGSSSAIYYSYDGYTWTVSDTTSVGSLNCTAVASQKLLYTGVETRPQSIPPGGDTGQVLAKISGEPYDTVWVTGTGGGGSATVPTEATMVAGGSSISGNNTMTHSYDGITWTATDGSSIFSGQLRGVAWNGSMWVGVGEDEIGNAVIASSADGMEWTPCVISGSIATAVAWNGSLWVAAIDDTMVYSFDAVEWQEGTIVITTGDINSGVISIVWNGSSFTGITTTKIFNSFDGMNWTETVNTTDVLISSNVVATNGSMTLIGGSGTTSGILYSYNGVNWTASDADLIVYSIAWNGSVWVAVGGNGGATAIYAYSADGITWTLENLAGFTECNTVAWNGSVWVLQGLSSTVAKTAYTSSVETEPWTVTNFLTNIEPIASAARRLPAYMTLGSGSKLKAGHDNQVVFGGDFMYDSYNALQMASVPNVFENLTSSTPISSIDWNGQFFLAITQQEFIYKYDNYTRIEPIANGFISTTICWSSSLKLWVLTAKGEGVLSIFYSSNGYNFDQSSATFDSSIDECTSMIWNGNMFLGTTNTHLLIKSTDGLMWSTTTVNGSSICKALGWNGSMWAAAGPGIWYSSDTLIWTQVVTNTLGNNQIASIGANGSIWLFGLLDGKNGYAGLYYTYDIANLNLNVSILPFNFTPARFSSIKWNGSVWIACSSDSVAAVAQIILSYDGINWFFNNNTVPSIINAMAIRKIQPFLESTGGFVGGGGGGGGGSLPGLSYDPSGPTGPMIVVGAHMVPSANVTYDLGATGMAFRDLYLSGSSIFLGESKISVVDGALNVNSAEVRYPTETFMVAATDNASNPLIYSYDGFTWLPSKNANDLFTNGRAVAWNGKIWMAGGSGGSSTFSIIRSSDGITWSGSHQMNNLFTSCNAIAWNGSIWVATGTPVGSNSLAFSNDDGNSWQGLIMTVDNGRTIAWNGSMWVAGGNGGSVISYSLDATSWSASEGSTLTACHQVAWNGVMWVAVGTSASGTSGEINYSYDGIRWYKSQTGNVCGDSDLFSVSWNGSLWVASGIGATEIGYSVNGIDWTESPTQDVFNECNGIAWNGSLWIAGGSDDIISGNGRIGYSSDGINWKPITSTIVSDSLIMDIAARRNPLLYIGKRPVPQVTDNFMVATGSGTNQLAYSYDGLNWNSATSLPFENSCYTVAWNGAMWVASGDKKVGGSSICYSSDGINWLPSNMSAKGYGNSLAWNGTMWLVGVSAGENYCIAYSYDGINWTTSPSSFDFLSDCIAVAWNGTMWVAGGYGLYCMIYSYDGINWIPCLSTTWGAVLGSSYAGISPSFNPIPSLPTSSGTSSANACRTIAWNGSMWLAGTYAEIGNDNNTIFSSSDGINWTEITSANPSVNPFTPRCLALAWNGSMWVGGGEGTCRIAYSTDGYVWTEADSIDPDFVEICSSVAWNGTIWIAGGGTSNPAPGQINMLYSYDGKNWSRSSASSIFGQPGEPSSIASRRVLPYVGAKPNGTKTTSVYLGTHYLPGTGVLVTPPPGALAGRLTLSGGGGGGGSYNGSTTAGGGGGAGACSIHMIPALAATLILGPGGASDTDSNIYTDGGGGGGLSSYSWDNDNIIICGGGGGGGGLGNGYQGAGVGLPPDNAVLGGVGGFGNVGGGGLVGTTYSPYSYIDYAAADGMVMPGNGATGKGVGSSPAKGGALNPIGGYGGNGGSDETIKSASGAPGFAIIEWLF
jgi:hypothetical protein